MKNTLFSLRRPLSVEDTLYIAGWCFAALLLFFAVRRQFAPFLSIPCPFHAITGLYCPGCGGTRAVIALLHGRLLSSFLYHPFVPYGAVCCGWFMFSQTVERLSRHRLRIGMKYRDIYLWIAVALVALHFLVKNACLLLWSLDLNALS